jgi:hypothetical protein
MPKGTKTFLKPVYTYEDDEVSIIVSPINFKGYKRSVENKWLIKQYFHKYYENNKEEIIQKSRKWNDEHPDAYKIIRKKYNKDYRLKKKLKEEQKKNELQHNI